MLKEVFERFSEQSPVPVMLRGVLSYVFPKERLDELFVDNAVTQREDELLFSLVVDTLALAVTGIRKSVHAAYKAKKEKFTVSVRSLYNKLAGTETQTSQALVQESAARLEPVIKCLRAQLDPLLPRYRTKIIDGNHLAATEHRLKGSRGLTDSPLPGLSLVVLDPQLRLAIDAFPLEDPYAQERSLFPHVVETVEKRDLWIADRNFCTTGFLFGIRDRGAFFIIRQHGQSLQDIRLIGRRRRVCRCDTGVIYEQQMEICNRDEEDPQRRVMRLRRITIVLDKPTRDNETELHILTNLPEKDADAKKVAELYRDRWTIENVFHELDQSLQAELNTLCYPKAGLLAFCVGLYTYNMLSVVKAAIRSEHKDPKLLTELSGYYLAEEIAAISGGMMVTLEPRFWDKKFSHLAPKEMATTLRSIAKHVDPDRFRKNKRGPKKPPPKRKPRRGGHVSAARLIAQGRAQKPPNR